jgi:hypothetical protein
MHGGFVFNPAVYTIIAERLAEATSQAQASRLRSCCCEKGRRAARQHHTRMYKPSQISPARNLYA